MPSPITLLVAYRKELIRAGLRAMLNGTSVKIVAESTDAPGTLTLAKKHKPAVLLIGTDIQGADSFELVKKLAKSVPETKFVFLSASDNPTYMARAKAAGAANFLLKNTSSRELITAIEHAAAGKARSGSGLFATVSASMEPRDARAARESGLTPRESQVLSHVAFGLSNEEISRSLGISIETVKEHVQNLLRKLAVNDRTQAAVWAVQSGVV